MIPAKLLTDIDNASPPELWDRLAMLAEWLEESGDLRADGVRWLGKNERFPHRWNHRQFTLWMWRGVKSRTDWPECTTLANIPKRRLLYATLSDAYLAAAQAFVDARYGTEATEPAS